MATNLNHVADSLSQVLIIRRPKVRVLPPPPESLENNNLDHESHGVKSVVPRVPNRCAVGNTLAVLFCPSPNGKVFAVTIDRSDLERVLAAGEWHVGNFRPKRGVGLYCYRNKPKGGLQLLHRFILDAPKGAVVDHRHHRNLDNRRSEIRLASTHQNAQNSRTRKDSSNGYKGVTLQPSGRFRARIWVNGVRRSLGFFPTAVEAAREYDRQALIHHGEFAQTNFGVAQ